MRKLLALACSLLAVGCWVSCSEKLSPEQAAAEAALSYYQRLVDGYPDGMVAAKADVDSLPDELRQQLVKAYRQYVADMQRQHGGLKSVSISSNVGKCDTLTAQTSNLKPQTSKFKPQTSPLVYAFLLLTFADSTQEEICVPMVERDGDWLMR